MWCCGVLDRPRPRERTSPPVYPLPGQVESKGPNTRGHMGSAGKAHRMERGDMLKPHRWGRSSGQKARIDPRCHTLAQLPPNRSAVSAARAYYLRIPNCLLLPTHPAAL